MGIYDLAAWGVILSLSLMVIGGLVLWAYGARRPKPDPIMFAAMGPETEATRLFHLKLTRWFFTYGVSVIVAGAGMLLWAMSVLFF